MSDKSAIEWTRSDDGTPGATWNPLRAGSGGKWYCERISPGCDNCYASTFNRRLGGSSYPSVGEVGTFQRHGLNPVHLDQKALEQPFHWRKGRRIFVCSMTDLFGEWVTDEQRDRVFAVMALTPQHTYMVLTKRPTRMRDYLGHMPDVFDDYEFSDDDIRTRLTGAMRSFDLWPDESEDGYATHGEWPLPNVWAGVTVESPRYVWRVNVLRQTPAVVRFVSFEPLLQDVGPLNLDGIHWAISGGESGQKGRWLVERALPLIGKPGWSERREHAWTDSRGIAWVPTVGGLSAVRSIRDQCNAAGVAYFHKQWGGASPKAGGRELDGLEHNAFPAARELVTA